MREARGLLQKDMADRLPTYYSSEGNYARAEQGRRLPERDGAVAILRDGLRLMEIPKINEALALAGYDPLTPEEASLIQPASADRSLPPVVRSPSPVDRALATPSRYLAVTAAATLVGFAIAAASGLDLAITMLCALLYAGLYAVSVCLETAYAPALLPVAPTASVVFALMLISSIGAVAIDHALVLAEQAVALPAALVVSVLAAVAQWVIARTVLPSVAVVRATFEPHTAQVAHLKNTGYFLLIVFLFWLPPLHCVTVLRRQIALGQEAWVRTLLSQTFLVGRNLICFKPAVLWVVLLVMAIITIPMGSKLLDNLPTHGRKNVYSILLYLRGALYFSLATICLGWYSVSLASLLP